MRNLTTGVVVADDRTRLELRSCLLQHPVQVVLDDASQLESLQVKRLCPELLFLDSSPGWEPLEVMVRRIKSVCTGIVVVVVNEVPDTDAILAAMRAGADEYLFPPFADRVKPIIERASAQACSKQYSPLPGGKVIGFTSAKGGCGATSVACHVAAELPRTARNEVLLADFDLEQGIVGFLLKAKTSYSILDAIRNLHRLDSSFWKGLVANGRPRLDVMPAPAGLLVHDALRPEQFRSVFRLMRSMYAWVVADLGRNLSLISLALLEDIDDFFLVTGLDVPSLYHAKSMAQRMFEFGFPKQRLHLIINRVTRQRSITTAEVQEFLSVPVYAELPAAGAVDEAYAEGRLADRGSDFGRHITSLVSKLSGVPQEAPKPRFFLLPARKSAVHCEGV